MRKIYCDWCNKEIGIDNGEYYYQDKLYDKSYDLCDECKETYMKIWDDLSQFEIKEKERYKKELETKRKKELKKLFKKYGVGGENL